MSSPWLIFLVQQAEVPYMQLRMAALATGRHGQSPGGPFFEGGSTGWTNFGGRSLRAPCHGRMLAMTTKGLNETPWRLVRNTRSKLSF
jgi:hypothetical protein